MSNKHYIGLDLTSFQDNGKTLPVSRVTLSVDEENVITVGDDSGKELLAECPYATKAMAQSILDRLKGYRYQMFEASDANLDPAAELGDGITGNGVYGVISRISDDGKGRPGITGPGQQELEEEYPMGSGPMMQEVQRKFAYQDKKLASTRSLITRTSEAIDLKIEEINTEVSGYSGKFSDINTRIDSIKLTVSNNGTSSSIQLTGNGISSEAQTITFTGYVTFGGLSGGTTTINGNCLKTGIIRENTVESKALPSFWNLETGQFVTYDMLAHNIQADGVLTCGGNRGSKLVLSAGEMKGYLDDKHYGTLNVNMNLIVGRNTYHGFLFNCEALCFQVDQLAIRTPRSASTAIVPYTGSNNIISYVGWDEDGPDGQIRLFSNTLEVSFLSGFCTYFFDFFGSQIYNFQGDYN